MPNDWFQFKQFKIHQNKCAMKVGTDGVLLGAWVKPDKAKRILDIGTGTGLLALMLAQKSNAIIDAIEIHPAACEQAKENFIASSWASRLNVSCTSLQKFVTEAPGQYDLIVCNPPYFNNSFKPTNPARSSARHNDGLSPSELFEAVEKLLFPDGRFCIILPTENAESFINESSFFVKRKCNVKSLQGKPPVRVMLELTKLSSATNEDELIIEAGERHHYTDSYKELTKDYYLNF